MKNDIQALNIGIEEREFKVKSLKQDLGMTRKQLERLEEQNRVFDSESLSSDSDEETKSGKPGNSFDDSAGRNTPNNRSNNNISRDMDKTKANTTGKSTDSAIESNEYRALQESLDSFN